jgi:TolB protein
MVALISVAAHAPAEQMLLFAGGEPGGGVGLWLAAPDGSAPRLITEQATGWNTRPSASADGSRIVFTSTREGQDEELFLASPDGELIQRLTDSPGPDRQPYISSEADLVAFVSTRDDALGDLYTIATTGQGLKRLTEHLAVESPAVAPDGSIIVFSAKPSGGTRNLWVCGPDGENMFILVSTEYADREPSFSPDGQTLYFVSGAGETFGVYSVPITGGEVELVLAFPGVSRPTVSPDGTLLAFTSAFGGGVYVAEIDGANPNRVSEGTDPTWIDLPSE